MLTNKYRRCIFKKGSVSLSIRPFIYLSVRLSIGPSIHLSDRPSVCLSACLSVGNAQVEIG